jgi:hypothetical protein
VRVRPAAGLGVEPGDLDDAHPTAHDRWRDVERAHQLRAAPELLLADVVDVTASPRASTAFTASSNPGIASREKAGRRKSMRERSGSS